MKTFRKIFIMGVVLIMPLAAHALTSVTSASVRVYKMYLSTSALCTAPFQTVDFGSSGTLVDMAATPTIGAGSVNTGTYPCVIFKMSDAVSFVPSANDGSLCTAGTTYTIDVCQTRGSTTVTTTNPEDGSSTTCTSGTDTVWVYLSTGATSTTGSSTNNTFTPPTSTSDATHGLHLSSSVVISAAATGTFTFGTTNKVDGSGGSTSSCDMQPPDFGFSL